MSVLTADEYEALRSPDGLLIPVSRNAVKKAVGGWLARRTLANWIAERQATAAKIRVRHSGALDLVLVDRTGGTCHVEPICLEVSGQIPHPDKVLARILFAKANPKRLLSVGQWRGTLGEIRVHPSRDIDFNR